MSDLISKQGKSKGYSRIREIVAHGFSYENAAKKIPYLKSAAVFFLLFIFIYVNIETMMVWPHFLATCLFALFLEIRKIVIRNNKKALETFISFDVPFLVFFGAVALLTAVISIVIIWNQPALIIFSALFFAISWGGRIPKFGDAGHMFRNIWVPVVLTVFLCFWWMGYMQKTAPDCNNVHVKCPSRWWINIHPRRYFFTQHDGSDSVYIIYPFNRYVDRIHYKKSPVSVERLPIEAPGAYAVDKKRDLFYLGDSDRGFVKVLKGSDFSPKATFNYKKYWPDNDKPYACQIDYNEKNDKIVIYSCQKEISVFSASDYKHEGTYTIQQPAWMKAVFPHYIFSAFSYGDGTTYVATWAGDIHMVDLDDGKTIRRKWLGSPVQFIYPDIRRKKIYATTLSGRFFILDSKTLNVMDSIRGAAGVRYASVAPDGKTFFFKSYTSGKVMVYSLETKRKSDEVFIGRGNGWVEFSPETNELLALSSC